MHQIYSGWLAFCLSVLGICLAAQANDDDEKYVYKYAVVGKTREDPVVRQLSLDFDTRKKAEEDLAERQFSYHDKRGQLYGTPEEAKPIGMRVATYRYPKGSPSELQEVRPDDTPAFPKPKAVDIGPPKKKSILAGRTGVGKFGRRNATIEFGRDLQFTLSGDVRGNGKWSETDTGGVFMETERSTFRGNIDGNKVSGLWFTKDGSKPAAEWSVVLQTLNGKAAAIDAVVGIWDANASQFVRPGDITHEYRKDGTGTTTITSRYPDGKTTTDSWDFEWKRADAKLMSRRKGQDEWIELPFPFSQATKR